MTKHEALTRANFLEGYNCAQAVLLAFAEDAGLEKNTALRLASSFGGGVGGMREMCGALSGACMAAGLLFGYDSPDAKEEKAAHYARIRTIADAFRAEFGTILCRDILGLGAHPKPTEPQPRTAEYFTSVPVRTWRQPPPEFWTNTSRPSRPMTGRRKDDPYTQRKGGCHEKACDWNSRACGRGQNDAVGGNALPQRRDPQSRARRSP